MSMGLKLHHHLRPRLIIIQWVVESANYTMRGAEVHWPVVHSWHQCGTSLWHTYIDVEDLLFAIVVHIDVVHCWKLLWYKDTYNKCTIYDVKYIYNLHLHLQLAFQFEIGIVDLCWSTSISGTCQLVHYGIFASDMICGVQWYLQISSILSCE